MQFEDIGKHCTNCKRKDFLPFKCAACDKYYCTEHIKKHECVEATIPSKYFIECPMCYKLLTCEPVEDPNMVWELHHEIGCVESKTRCDTCGKLFSEFKTFKCTYCSKINCDSHRSTHKCESANEICPMCKKTFTNVEELIKHAEKH